MKHCLIAMHAALLVFTGCSAKSDANNSPEGSVSVSVHGVNYTADPFDYRVAKPNDDDKSGAGEHIGPFSAGGTVCCFDLPKKWKPGIKLRLYTNLWIKDSQNPEGHSVRKTEVVELPRYADGEAGELWVLRTAEGGLDVMSSNLQPDHPQWPGKVKGWPEPSLEFRRERWALLQSQAVGEVKIFQSALEEVEEKQDRVLKEFWQADQERRAEEVRNFTGPSDPRYVEYVKIRLKEALHDSQLRVEQGLREKP